MTKLKCVMFCEFDPHVGPQIAFQYPQDFIKKDEMDLIAHHIIPKTEFQGCIIALKAYKYTFLGYPVVLIDKKYHRNALFFNVVFVFDENETVVEYEPVVKKLAGYLTTLEVECGYLSTEKGKANLPHILQKIYEDLRSKGECTIPVDQCNTIFLKVVKLPKEPPSVFDHQVPVLLWSRNAIESKHWDLTAQHVLPFIDGCNHVQKIASVTDVDLGLVRSALQTLLFHGVIALVPVFLYSNMYAVKPKINDLMTDAAMKTQCVSFVAKDLQHPPHFRDVFMLYCALGPGISANTLCTRHDPPSLGVDEQKLIQYGLMKKLVHKLDKYPVTLTSEVQHHSKWKEKTKWFNGYYSYEEICCKSTAVGVPLCYETIDSLTENNPYVVHIWK